MSKYNETQLEQLTNGMASRAYAHYIEATDLEREAGEGWYFVAHQEARLLAKRYDTTVTIAAAVIAVLSPLTRWAGNLEDADRVFSRQRAIHALPLNERKALSIIHGSDPDRVLGGKKVRAFWRNIENPDGKADVVIDTWMARAFGLDPAEVFNITGVYEATAAAVVKGAAMLADEFGVITPSALQAVMWVRTINKHKRGTSYPLDNRWKEN